MRLKKINGYLPVVTMKKLMIEKKGKKWYNMSYITDNM